MLLALTVASGHSGVAHPRNGPELSDFALFACAAVAIWLLRRRLRKRAKD
jgi:hypothetical protein